MAISFGKISASGYTTAPAYVTDRPTVIMMVPKKPDPEPQEGEFGIRVGEPSSPFDEVETIDWSGSVVSIKINWVQH